MQQKWEKEKQLMARQEVGSRSSVIMHDHSCRREARRPERITIGLRQQDNQLQLFEPNSGSETQRKLQVFFCGSWFAPRKRFDCVLPVC